MFLEKEGNLCLVQNYAAILATMMQARLGSWHPTPRNVHPATICIPMPLVVEDFSSDEELNMLHRAFAFDAGSESAPGDADVASSCVATEALTRAPTTAQTKRCLHP